MISTIRFKRDNRYRKPIGSLDSQMGFGIHSALVQRGIAEFVDTTAVISPAAVEVSEPDQEPIRKSRRHKES
jgi:hypothetical protein